MKSPTAQAGSEAYRDRLASRLSDGRFPEPDPDVVPELTEARHVAEAAADDGDEAFARSVLEHREAALDPLRAYDTVMQVVSLVERGDVTDLLDDGEIDELERDPLFEDVDLVEDDPAAIRDEALDARERTFLDYPAPPHHLLEAGRSEGRDLLEADGRDEEFEAAIEAADGDREAAYLEERRTIEAVVRGAAAIARETVDEEAFPAAFDGDGRSGYEYEGVDHYADVVAFNAGLAAESMLEREGELVTPP